MAGTRARRMCIVATSLVLAGPLAGCATLLAPVLGCGALDNFEPRSTSAYTDYAINGELEVLQYRSYLRSGFIPIVQEAARTVEASAGAWETGHGSPIGLGDMSECDGSIPGTSVGAPAHPSGTHLDGHDIDIAYYQAGTPDNRLRAVCPSELDGSDANRCTGTPDHLDAKRTALFVDTLAASGKVRVIGVDGWIGPLIKAELESLCLASLSSCTPVPLAYETTNTGLGWFRGHHHHMHVSFLPVDN